jgi:hypothetical protein
MKNLYGIFGDDTLFAFVRAKDELEAFNIFAEEQINDNFMNEYFSYFTVSDSLYADFFRDDLGSLWDVQKGTLEQRVKA